MHLLAAIVGVMLLALVLVDAFNTLVLARRTEHIFRIARLYYAGTWNPFAAVARRVVSSRTREAFLAVYGPLSLLTLFALWAVTLILAFALLQWAAEMQPETLTGSFGDDLYLSASTLFTLSSGDPVNTISRVIAVFEGGLGLAFLGLVVGYLPVLYQSFANRELRISLLDAVAGSPPSAGALLQYCPVAADRFEKQLSDWEEWAAAILEQNLSFPMLAFFRSQHANQSWLTALVAIVDCSAIVSLCAKDDLHRQADLTFAMARHVIADISAVFRLRNPVAQRPRLSPEEFQILREIVAANPELFDATLLTEEKLASRRRMYELPASAISEHFLMALPPWMPGEANRDNWRVSSGDRGDTPYAVSDPFAE